MCQSVYVWELSEIGGRTIMEVCKLGVMKNKLFDPIEMWGGMNC